MCIPELVENRLKERGLSMKAEVEVIGLEVQKKLTALGLGIALLPRSFVMTDLQQGSLSALRQQRKASDLFIFDFQKGSVHQRRYEGVSKLLQENFVSAKKLLQAVVE